MGKTLCTTAGNPAGGGGNGAAATGTRVFCTTAGNPAGEAGNGAAATGTRTSDRGASGDQNCGATGGAAFWSATAPEAWDAACSAWAVWHNTARNTLQNVMIRNIVARMRPTSIGERATKVI